MTVLVVLPGVTPDAGTEQSFLAVAPSLVAAGTTLHLAVLTERQTSVPALSAIGVTVHDLSSVRGQLRVAQAVRRLAADLRPDLVHASLHEAVLPSQLAVVGTGVPVLVTWANTNYGAGRLSDPNVRRWKLELLRAAETVLGRASGSWYQAVTPAVGRVNGRAVRAPQDRILLGMRGRDPDRFPYRGTAPRPWPDGTGVAPGSRVVLAVGRQEPQKDYGLLLRAFDSVAAHRDDVALVVAGRTGSSTGALTSLTASLPSRDRIHLLGHRDDVADLMAAADVVVCSSLREGAAGALIEAMACGVPVVSVPVAGLEGILVHGGNSLVVPRESLGHGIERVLDEPALAERLSAQGRAAFEARFTTAAAVDQMLEIYRTVAATRS